MKDAINWFELPVSNLARAQKFYETVLEQKLRPEHEVGGAPMAIFEASPGVGGALVLDERRKPTSDGALVYLNCNGVLDACLARVMAAGGKVLKAKTDIGPPGMIAILVDTEGNQVGLHSEHR